MLNPTKSRWGGLGSKFNDSAFEHGHPFFQHLEIATIVVSFQWDTSEREHLLLRDGFGDGFG